MFYGRLDELVPVKLRATVHRAASCLGENGDSNRYHGNVAPSSGLTRTQFQREAPN